MKVIVDKMPDTPKECMYSEFKIYPPCIEQINVYNNSAGDPTNQPDAP